MTISGQHQLIRIQHNQISLVFALDLLQCKFRQHFRRLISFTVDQLPYFRYFGFPPIYSYTLLDPILNTLMQGIPKTWLHSFELFDQIATHLLTILWIPPYSVCIP